MRDLGLVTLDEPVARLFPQGMVHKDGEVMSKSKGNTVAPDDVIARYGADTLRLYILFAGAAGAGARVERERHRGPAPVPAPRLAAGRPRTRRRSRRSRAQPSPAELPAAARELRRKVHQTIQRVTRDVEERIQLNTAVAALMELVNEIYRARGELAAGAGHGRCCARRSRRWCCC